MRWQMRTRRVLVSIVVLLTLLVSVSTQSAAQERVCDDGRAWTEDVLGGSDCGHVNLCGPEQIELDVTTEVSWTWTFPLACPMDAIDAVGVLVIAEVPYDVGLGTAGRTRLLVSSHGTAAPERVGGNSIPSTCGDVELLFTVMAGSEVVATGQGQGQTAACEPIDLPDPPPAFLGQFDALSGDAGAFARLYWAVFGRVPDIDGFGYWMARADAGLPLRSAASTWTGLAEWKTTYADTDNGEFLDRVYQNVLGREPDRGGFEFWFEQLESGLTREELVVQFSGATEFRDRTGTT